MGNYSMVSSCALMCYVLLFSIFAAAKKNKILNAFLQILFVLIVWTGGSLMMRLQAWPGMDLWYHVSLIGIWASCFTLIRFMRVFAGSKMRLTELLMAVVAGIMLAVNCFTGFFLAPPVPVVKGGVTVFIYNMTTGTIVMYLFLVVVAVFALASTVRCYKSHVVTRQQFLPLMLGCVVMFAGQAIIMLPPFAGVPLDICAGVFYAVCLFYALYRRRLFTLTLAFSRRNYCIITAGILALLSVEYARHFQNMLVARGGFFAENNAPILAGVAVALAVLLYVLVKELSEYLFLGDEQDRSAALKTFNVEVSRSLHADSICQQLCQLLRSSCSGVTAISVVVEGDKGGYTVLASSSVMSVGRTVFSADNPVVRWCKLHPAGVRVSDFSYSVEYKSMWEEEKTQLNALNADYLFPLLDLGDLLGVVIITCKDRYRGLRSDDINFISSANTVASIAIKNSRMYEKACRDARTDDLTGLLNRKYFMEELQQRYDRDPNGLLSLAIINLDDFKLYNQLYGADEGDQALKRVANILAHNVGEDTILARYSGKEFALLMPNQEPAGALRQAENLRMLIYNMNRVEEMNAHTGAASIITCSIGICSIPFGASTVKQLLDNVDMTVYQVKQAGKNGVKIYAAGPDQLGQPLKVPTLNHQEVYSGFEQTIFALTATIDAKDHYTFTHSNNVAYYACKLAEACGMNPETIEIVREAALLHDIGKIGIPEDILNKPGRLTDEEYDIIKKHPENSVGIIRHLPNLDYLIPAVISHHERWDGRGYPRRIGGEDIPLSGRILCVADCFDAMTGNRCYQRARDPEQALQDLELNAGKQFDPELVKLFAQKYRDGFIELQIKRPALEA